MLRGPCARAFGGVFAALAVLASCALPAAASNQPLKSSDLIALKAAKSDLQKLKPIKGGVKETTIVRSLDGLAGTTLAAVCEKNFASESKREAREQVSYTIQGPKGPLVAASNEVVLYRAGGASEAYSELMSAVASCPSSYALAGGNSLSQSQMVPVAHGLASETVALAQYLTQAGDPSVWQIGIYQFHGNYLTAVYVYNPTLPVGELWANQLAASAHAQLKVFAG